MRSLCICDAGSNRSSSILHSPCLLQVSMCSGTPRPTFWGRPWSDITVDTYAMVRLWKEAFTTTWHLKEGEHSLYVVSYSN